MPIAKVVVLVVEVGTVAENVHWIVVPLIKPFTLFAFTWKAKGGEGRGIELSTVYECSRADSENFVFASIRCGALH